MRIVYRRCAGLDVHKDSVSACIRRTNPFHTARKLTRRLEQIGFSVAVQARPITPVQVNLAVPPEGCSKCNRWRLPKCIHHNP